MPAFHPEFLRGFHEGQRDALILMFPSHVGGNTKEHFSKHKAQYDSALEDEFIAHWHGEVADPYLTGYASGTDAMVLEAEELLGITFGEKE